MGDFAQTYKQENPVMIVCGGVAANKTVRQRLDSACAKNGFDFLAPPLEYCTDNGAMIAWAGLEMLRSGQTSPLSLPARPRWPLELLKERSA